MLYPIKNLSFSILNLIFALGFLQQVEAQEANPAESAAPVELTPVSPTTTESATSTFDQPKQTFPEPKKAKTSRELFLVRDMPQTLPFDYDIGEIAVGNPAVVAVVADRARRRIVLSPLEVGATSILVFDTAGKQRENISITVSSTDLDQFLKDLKFQFRDIEGLQFERVGRRVVVEGEVYIQADLDRINDVLKGNDFVVNRVSLSQDSRRILAKRIKDEINISGVEVTTVKDKIVLKGEVASDDESKRAEAIALIYAEKDTIRNVIAVNPKKSSAKPARLIQVTAYFVELNKSFLRNFNFQWTPIASTQFGYTNIQGKGSFNFLATVTEFLPKLNTAKALGVARVFENPTVSVKSGDAASVESGGDVYLPQPSVVSEGKTGDSQKPANTGVTLNVTPTADERDFVDMKIDVEVRKLGSAPAEAIMLINNSKVSTTHYVRSGETVAIGGVLRSAFSDVKDAPPGQAFSFQNPITGQVDSNSFGNIFQVFKSRAVSQDRTMFIVFITPEILSSARDSSKNLREMFNTNSVEATKGSEEFE